MAASTNSMTLPQLERPVDRRAADLRSAVAHADHEILRVEMPVGREDLVEEGGPLARDLQALFSQELIEDPAFVRVLIHPSKISVLPPRGNPPLQEGGGKGGYCLFTPLSYSKNFIA